MEKEPPAWRRVESAESQVGSTQRTWIETSMTWFVEEFGRHVLLRDIALPDPEFFPFPHLRTVERVDALVKKVRHLMAVEADDILVELFDGSDEGEDRSVVGHYQERDGRPVIGLDRREAAHLPSLTAIIAHELCHVRLLGEDRVTTDRSDHERLTDLLTVYLGFGIFTTNAAERFARANRPYRFQPLGYLSDQMLNGANGDGTGSHVGYLTQPEFGYALACYSHLRGETSTSWANYLDPGARVFLQQGLAYLARHGKGTDLPNAATTKLPFIPHLPT